MSELGCRCFAAKHPDTPLATSVEFDAALSLMFSNPAMGVARQLVIFKELPSGVGCSIGHKALLRVAAALSAMIQLLCSSQGIGKYRVVPQLSLADFSAIPVVSLWRNKP